MVIDDIVNLTRKGLLLSLLAAVIAVIPSLEGCKKKEEPLPQTQNYVLQRFNQRNMPAPNNSIAYNESFASMSGGYSLPLRSAQSAAAGSIDSELEQQVINAFVVKHSSQNLWTYIMGPYTAVVQQVTGVVGPSKAGSDKILRLYGGKDIATILTIWSPINSPDIKEDFYQSIKVFKDAGVWTDNSESEIMLDGKKGMSGRYIVSFGNDKMYSTFMLVHSNEKRYQIVFSYTGGFNDPDNTLNKVKQIEFLK